ncbi:MAG: hypothetical protein RI909_642, partial [Bacteroidota bacterium]
MYTFLIRPILFLFPPEFIHHFTFRVLMIAGKIPGVLNLLKSAYLINDKSLERILFGITFKNPVG